MTPSDKATAKKALRSIHGVKLCNGDRIQRVVKWRGQTAILERFIGRVMQDTDGNMWAQSPHHTMGMMNEKWAFVICAPDKTRPSWQCTISEECDFCCGVKKWFSAGKDPNIYDFCWCR